MGAEPAGGTEAADSVVEMAVGRAAVVRVVAMGVVMAVAVWAEVEKEVARGVAARAEEMGVVARVEVRVEARAKEVREAEARAAARVEAAVVVKLGGEGG